MHDEARVCQSCSGAAASSSHWRVSAFCSCMHLSLAQHCQFISSSSSVPLTTSRGRRRCLTATNGPIGCRCPPSILIRCLWCSFLLVGSRDEGCTRAQRHGHGIDPISKCLRRSRNRCHRCSTETLSSPSRPSQVRQLAGYEIFGRVRSISPVPVKLQGRALTAWKLDHPPYAVYSALPGNGSISRGYRLRKPLARHAATPKFFPPRCTSYSRLDGMAMYAAGLPLPTAHHHHTMCATLQDRFLS